MADWKASGNFSEDPPKSRNANLRVNLGQGFEIKILCRVHHETLEHSGVSETIKSDLFSGL